MIFHPNSEKNKFGFYQVGDVCTYSKFRAIEHSLKTNARIEWNFNSEVLRSHDLKKEPSESLPSMYRRRAQWIRDHYDYVVLMYSGGIDSTNMLKSFFDNGIIPDEICTVYEYEGTKHRHAFLTGEIINSAIPYVKSNIESRFHTKFRLVDTSQQQYDTVRSLDTEFQDRSYYAWNQAHNLGNLARLDVRRFVDDYKKIIDSGRRLVLVWGETKPAVAPSYYDDRHQLIFVESSFDMICNAQQQEENDPGRFDEMFYTSPDFFEISIKQAHLCLERLKNFDKFRSEMMDIDSAPTDVESLYAPGFMIKHLEFSEVRTRHQGIRFCLKKSCLERMLYPGVDLPIYTHGKNVDRLYHPRDWWLRKALPEQSRDWYRGYVQKIQGYGKEWNKLGQSKRYGLARLENRYDLE